MVDFRGLSVGIVEFQSFARKFEATVPIRPCRFPLITCELVCCAWAQFFESAYLVDGSTDFVPLEICFDETKSVVRVIG